MSILLTAVAVWAATGVIIAAIMARHGHNFWLFAAMGLAYGPLLVLVWFEGARGQESKAIVLPSGGLVNESGWIDVLIGLDGSRTSIESARVVLNTLGPAVHRLRLSSVVDHETLNSPDAFETDDKRMAYLCEAAEALEVPNAEVALVSGQVDKALRDHAGTHAFDLIVVGGHRLASGLRGSTASRLVKHAEIPVLVGPPF